MTNSHAMANFNNDFIEQIKDFDPAKVITSGSPTYDNLVKTKTNLNKAMKKS